MAARTSDDGQIRRGLDVDRHDRDPTASFLQHGVRTVRAVLRRTGLHRFHAMQTNPDFLDRADDDTKFVCASARVIDTRSSDDRFADPR